MESGRKYWILNDVKNSAIRITERRKQKDKVKILKVLILPRYAISTSKSGKKKVKLKSKGS